jgi:two-component system LytT family response regulator
MNILIIEDEAIAADRIRQIVAQTVADAQIVGHCDSIEESVAFLNNQAMPDLILMDIELVDGQSFEIFEEVEVTCPVIFTTAYDEYALQAFSVHSIDYLLKPIQAEELQRSIAKFRKLQQMYGGAAPAINTQALLQELRKVAQQPADGYNWRQHFLVRQGQRLLSIGVDDVAYFYSEGRVTFLKTGEGKFFALDQPLEEVEQQVDPKRFFRSSRKYLTERRSIQNIVAHFNGKYKLTLKPATTDDVFVSRDRAPEFRKWLGG